MNRKDWITILASSVTTIFVCIITIWSNININSKINETNLLISDTTSKTTFTINNQEQLESRFRYIADLMVENIGTNNSDMIIDFANLLIQDLKKENAREAQELQNLLDTFILENNLYWSNKTNNFHRFAADCFSEIKSVREQGMTNMLNNFDVKNLDACISSMLDIALLNETLDENTRLIGFANFSYFITRYTDVEIYRQYAADNVELYSLLNKIKQYGGLQAQKDIEYFESRLAES